MAYLLLYFLVGALAYGVVFTNTPLSKYIEGSSEPINIANEVLVKHGNKK